MEEKNLHILYRQLIERNKNPEKIKVNMIGNRLDITLDLGTGFKGYENGQFREDDQKFNIGYFGLFSNAFNTFLNDSQKERVDSSIVLTHFRNHIRNVKSEKKVEIYNELRNEIDSRMINYHISHVRYDEAEKAALFLSDRFNERAR